MGSRSSLRPLLLPPPRLYGIEPLVEVNRGDTLVTGIEVGPIRHQISLYADNVILDQSNPESSIARVIEIIRPFGQMSGYKMNYSKSVAMPLNSSIYPGPQVALPIFVCPLQVLASIEHTSFP